MCKSTCGLITSSDYLVFLRYAAGSYYGDDKNRGTALSVYLFISQDTVGAPAGLCDRVADAVWVKLLQWRHGNRIPDLHAVPCGHQAGHLLHGNTWR